MVIWRSPCDAGTCNTCTMWRHRYGNYAGTAGWWTAGSQRINNAPDVEGTALQPHCSRTTQLRSHGNSPAPVVFLSLLSCKHLARTFFYFKSCRTAPAVMWLHGKIFGIAVRWHFAGCQLRARASHEKSCRRAYLWHRHKSHLTRICPSLLHRAKYIEHDATVYRGPLHTERQNRRNQMPHWTGSWNWLICLVSRLLSQFCTMVT